MNATLYRHFSKDGELLYVGHSMNVLLRTSMHARTAKWFKEISYITVEHFDNLPAAMDAEIKAISSESPRENLTYKQDDLFRRKRRKYVSLHPHKQLDSIRNNFRITESQLRIIIGATWEQMDELREQSKNLDWLQIRKIKVRLKTTYKKLSDLGVFVIEN